MQITRAEANDYFNYRLFLVQGHIDPEGSTVQPTKLLPPQNRRTQGSTFKCLVLFGQKYKDTYTFRLQWYINKSSKCNMWAAENIWFLIENSNALSELL